MQRDAESNRTIQDACLEKLRHASPNPFRGKATDFMTKYYAVFQLRTFLEAQPMLIDAQSIAVVANLLRSDAFNGQHQGFFLFREAAETLVSCMIRTGERSLAGLSYTVLKDSLGAASGDKHRAIAGAMGDFPFHRDGPDVNHKALSRIPVLQWEVFLKAHGLEIAGRPTYIGRSLVARLKQRRRLLVCKMAGKDGSAADLQKEALWMEYLGSCCRPFPVRFDIPEVIKIGGGYVFSAFNFPRPGSQAKALHARGYAIGFLAHKDYFAYPNEPVLHKRFSNDVFDEVICRNARILGRLSAMGIIHSALIPLFHNRTQRNRRQDRGLYEWVRAGRLDRWIYSCAYPNIGLTGVRDFEHFDALKDTNQKLYRLIGNHFLSLFLVAGSYFRNKNIQLMGYDPEGRPTDARFLFEEDLLKEIVTGIFYNYYEGFVGSAYSGDIPIDMDRLIFRMIEEMGVDHHMAERLRVADQKAMSEGEFRVFLLERGLEKRKVDQLEKGVEDIVIDSGPHLGGFNEGISLPELIECVGTMSALCIAGRFREEQSRHIAGPDALPV
jgi:hypothetical protein